ncbi:MAG: DUF1822 family protein [Spirulina sp. SIO3F2]|nr:DUF1822 family protein [Spirulina sp. SIO3F2]
MTDATFAVKLLLMPPTAPALTLPVFAQAHTWARTFAACHSTEAKRRQVYLNTLAVAIVNDYLQQLDIPTALEQSLWWQPEYQVLDVGADLFIPDFGTVTCCPVLADADRCELPPGEQQGCIAVQFDARFGRATLVGYVSADDQNWRSLPLAEFEDFSVLLAQLPEAESVAEPIAASHPLDQLLNQFPQLLHAPTLNTLSDWLTGAIADSWQPLDRLLTPYAMPLATARTQHRRTTATIERCKLLTLTDAVEPIALVVMVNPQSPQTMEITVELWATNEQQQLPDELEFQLLNESGVPVMQAHAQGSNHLQFVFRANLDDTFDVCVMLQTAQVIESFVI